MAITGDSNGELEKKLWETAEKLRGPVDPSEYKDFALGLLFLKSMSDSFEARRKELEETIEQYNEGFLSTQQVIDELRDYADEIQESDDRQDELGLSDEELAFFDAISSNTDTEIEEEKLKSIAQELKQNLKDRVELDWTNRDKIRAEIKTEVKAVLRSNGLSLYKHENLVDPIVAQAEAFYGGAAA